MKNSITAKLIISHLVIVLAALACVGLISGFSAKSFLERQAKRSLREDAQIIAEINRSNADGSNGTNIGRIKQLIRDRLSRGSRLIDSSYAIVSRDLMRVLYLKGNNGEDELEFSMKALPEIRKKLHDNRNLENLKDINFKVKMYGREHMVVVMPALANMGHFVKNWIILYTPVAPIHQIGRAMLVPLIFALIIIALLAVIAGIIFSRSIARPIIALQKRAELLSKRDFDTKVNINTGDELEDLAKTIDKMAAELKEYDNAQKRFLQNASHELKTPLMSIQGYAEGIRDGVFEDNERALEIISEESIRLKKIVDELIYLSKLETMDDFYRLSKESCADILKSSVEKVESLALKNGIKINTILSRDFTITVDRDKFVQALINILGNCLRHAKSEVVITSCRKEDWLVIEIYDDGEGLDDADLKNIFERFYKGKKGNTGLGLAITKVIIEKHRGSIKAENRPDGGAQFTIWLPID